MKQIIGNAARKEQFYKRLDIRSQILEAVQNNENLLLSAPRRVGKTSILFDLVDAPDDNVYAVYVNTEAITESEKFFQHLLRAMLNADMVDGFGKFGREAKEKLKHWANKIAGIKVAGVGVDIRPEEKVSYYNQLVEFLRDVDLEGKVILLLVDEFPITIEHIYNHHGQEEVLRFLDQNRALRQPSDFSHKIKFAYTGSIGLFPAVKRINGTDRINDLREIKVRALNREGATEFINQLWQGKFKEALAVEYVEYILNKIEWWIPFYFQLLIKELGDILQFEDGILNTASIDAAFDNVVKNGNIYFEHFKSRLQKSFKDDNELKFVLQFLLDLKQVPLLEYNAVLDTAVKFSVQDRLNDILEVLEHDGYIAEEKRTYRFYSPILKTWWK